MEHSKANISWLEDIKKEAYEIQGQWNGDNAGRLEERADIAGDIVTRCNELIELINELND